jgi:hypothetical protein
MLIEKLVLRVNSSKQHDETTRQNNVVLFDRFDWETGVAR